MTYKTTAEPLILNLQLFAEGNAAGEGGTGTEGNAPAESGFATARKGRNANPLANVKYGIQEESQEGVADPTNGAEGSDAQPSREEAFEKYLEDNKDLFGKKVESIVKKRLKNSKASEESFEKLSPALSILAERYGIAEGDYDALAGAIEDDNSFFEDEAISKGMDVEEYKKIKQMERNNKSLTRKLDEVQRRENAEKLYNSWLKQAEEAKKTFPSLDLEKEIENPDFLDYLNSGMDVGKAYKAAHLDEIISGAMQITAKNVEQKLANKQMANSSMPIFNGSGSQSASTTKTDVSQLTKADRQEIIRRVQRGEKIRF